MKKIVLLFLIFVISCAPSKKEDKKLYTYGMADAWASYKLLFQEFKKKYGITRYDIDMSSGDVVERLVWEKENPIVDTAVVGITFAKKIKEKGLLGCYTSPHLNSLPKWAYDNENPNCPSWYATYFGTICFMVNTDVIKKVPKSWNDLLSPEYKNKIGYLDPTVSATGFATVIAATYSQGGTLTNLRPGIEYFEKLHAQGNIYQVMRSQNFIDFKQGRVPILINYDYNLLHQKEKHSLSAEVIIPSDGTVSYPYVNLVMKKPSHPKAAKLFFDFILSKEGQEILCKGYVKPVRKDIEIPSYIKEKVPPDAAYNSVRHINWEDAEDAMEKIKIAWQKFIQK